MDKYNMQKRRKSLRKLSVIFFFFVLQKILIHYPNQDKLHKFYLNRSILQYTHLEMVHQHLSHSDLTSHIYSYTLLWK